MLEGIFIKPLVIILDFIIKAVKDAGLAIILFTILIKIILSPLSFLQFQEELKIREINQKIKEALNKKENILEKVELLNKIYQEENFNPYLNLILQFFILLFSLAAIFAIQGVFKNIPAPYFLNIINLNKPNIFLGIIVLISQFFLVFTQPKESRKILLFLLGIFSVFIFILSSSFLLYIIMSILLTILERKLFNWYYIKFRVISIKKNDTERS